MANLEFIITENVKNTITKMAACGLTIQEIVDKLRINMATWHKNMKHLQKHWDAGHKYFLTTYQPIITKSLMQVCTGYNYKEIVEIQKKNYRFKPGSENAKEKDEFIIAERKILTKHRPPDPDAIRAMLKKINPEIWGDDASLGSSAAGKVLSDEFSILTHIFSVNSDGSNKSEAVDITNDIISMDNSGVDNSLPKDEEGNIIIKIEDDSLNAVSGSDPSQNIEVAFFEEIPKKLPVFEKIIQEADYKKAKQDLSESGITGNDIMDTYFEKPDPVDSSRERVVTTKKHAAYKSGKIPPNKKKRTSVTTRIKKDTKILTPEEIEHKEYNRKMNIERAKHMNEIKKKRREESKGEIK